MLKRENKRLFLFLELNNKLQKENAGECCLIYFFICLFIYLFVYLFIYLFIYLFASLSVCLYLFFFVSFTFFSLSFIWVFIIIIIIIMIISFSDVHMHTCPKRGTVVTHCPVCVFSLLQEFEKILPLMDSL